ncbi:MAG: efflux RND transporter periplasmic adaptor subunit [Bryobacteraceae bacterium]|jgi:membrane fusion protein, heavy metal efflux system
MHNPATVKSYAETICRANSVTVLLLVGLLELGCGLSNQATSGTSSQDQPVQPKLLTVSKEQIGHLTILPVHTTTWSITIHTTGTVDWDADHTTQAITQVNGPISRILVDYGSSVTAAAPLLYVSSPDMANAISTYRKARNREELAQRALDRSRQLLEHGAIAQKDLENAQADYNDAGTDVQNSLQALKIFGITKQEIDQAERQGVPISPELAVRSPIAGVVVQKLILPGQFIQAGTTVCFVLSDVSTVWTQGHIFDRDLPSIHVGDTVDESNASIHRRFHGVVSYIGALVDPTTRTTSVRIVTQNPEGLLKKDMFVEADVHTRTQKNVLAVPVSAVLHDAQNEPFVYVEVEPGKFAQRQITAGAEQKDSVEVLGGLKTGDRVVSEGSVFLQFSSEQ